MWIPARAATTLALLLAFAAAPRAAAQAPAAAPPLASGPALPGLEAVRLDGTLTVDGRVDEAAWADAPAVTRFVQQEPEPGEAATERTEARLLYDDDALYVAFRNYVEDPSTLVARIARRDEFPGGDRVSVDIDSRNDDRSGYFFAVTAGGTLQDGLLYNDVDADASWDAVFEAKTALTDYGWSAELRIPLAQLRFEAGTDAWGIQFQRDIAHTGERTFWAPILPTERGYVSRFGVLRGVGDLRPRQRFEVVPYVAARLARLPGADADPFYAANDVGANAGADVEVGFGPSLTLNATFNPDFGQVEADPAVLNLTQFENFFQERRPFFVEGTEIFDFGRTRTLNSDFSPRDFFYSRRIGAEPDYPLGGAYADAPTETTIAGAAKFTGRLGAWSVGVLDAVTTDEVGRFVEADVDGRLGAVEEVAVQPWANYAVGRVRRDFRGGRSTVGGLATATHRALSEAPLLASRLASSAYTLGLDFEHAFAGRGWIVSGVGAASHVRGSAAALVRLQRSPLRYYQRVDADGLAVDSAATSLSGAYGQLSLAKVGGNWLGSLTGTTAAPGFEVNDLGFQTRADVLSLAGRVEYRQNRPASPALQFWLLGSSQGAAWNYGGDRISTYLRVVGEAQYEGNWGVFGGLIARPEVFDDRLTRGGPVLKEPGEVSGSVGAYSDYSRPLYVEAEIGFERTGLGGYEGELELELGWQPTPAVRLEISPEIERTFDPLQYYGRATDANAAATFGRRYVFSDTRSTEFTVGTRLDWTFTPGLSLQLFLSPSIFAVDFGQLKALERPRTYDFVVFDEAQVAEDGGTLTIDADGDASTADAFTLRRRVDFNDRFLQGTAVLRWEYRPGSTVFLVWQHQRFGFDVVSDFDLGRDLGAVFDLPAENIFLVKASYWLGR